MSKKSSIKAQNDSVKASTYLNKMDELCAVRKEFEQNELARSNKRLYEILADVQRLYVEAAKNKGALAEALEILKKRINAQGSSRVQGNSKALSLFVRYVFNTDRQTAHIYSRAIQFAISEGVDADGLVEFILKAGGIDGCKKQAKPSVKQTEKLEAIEKTMPFVDEMLSGDTTTVLGEITVPAHLVEKTHQEGFTFLIGKADKQGNVKVVSVVPAQSDGMLKWAKKELALYFSTSKQVNDKQINLHQKDVAIEEAANAVITKMQSGEVTLAEVMDV